MVSEYLKGYKDGANFATGRIKQWVEIIKKNSTKKEIAHNCDRVLEEIAELEGRFSRINENVL